VSRISDFQFETEVLATTIPQIQGTKMTSMHKIQHQSCTPEVSLLSPRQLDIAMAFFLLLALTQCPPVTGDEGSSKAIGLRASQLFQPLAPEPSFGNAGFFVGVNTFTQDTGVSSLSFAVNDAIETAYLFSFELKLISPSRCFIAISGEPAAPSVKEHLEKLRAQGATIKQADRSAILLTFLQSAAIAKRESDLLVCSFSSHGFEDRGDAYVLPSDGVRQLLADTAVPLKTIETNMQNSKAGHRLLLVDACQERVSARGSSAGVPTSTAFMRALAAPTGQAKLASCSPGEFSFEHASLGGVGHGVFTHALLEALRGGARADADNLVHLGDVADYVSTNVLNWTKENRRPEQRPSLHCAVDARRLPLASKADDLHTLIESVRRQPISGGLRADIQDSLVEYLSQLDSQDSADRQLLTATRDFCSGQLPFQLFVPYVEQDRSRWIIPSRLTAQQLSDQAFAAAREITGTNASHYFRDVGILKSQLGDLKGAQECFRLAIDLSARLEHPFDKVSSLIYTAQAQIQAGDRVAGCQTFRKAVEVGAEGYTYAEVAEAQADSGEFTDALATANMISKESPATRDPAFITIACAQLKAGDAIGSQQTLRNITDPYHRMDGLVGIGRAQAEIGDLDGASETASQIVAHSHLFNKYQVLHEIAVAYAKKGKVPDAQKTVLKIDNDVVAGRAYLEIVDVLMKSSDIKMARQVADLIKDDEIWIEAICKIGVALAKAGNEAVAVQRFQEIIDFIERCVEKSPNFKTYRIFQSSVFKVIIAQADAGLPNDALKTVDLFKAAGFNDVPTQAVASAQIEKADLPTALSIARAAVPESDAKALYEAIIAQAIKRRTFSDALMVVNQADYGQEWKADCLEQIATAYAVQGNNEDAIRVLQLIEDSSTKKDALRRISPQIATNGDIVTAMKFLDANTLAPEERVDAIVAIANARAKQ
jgi:tetratricopeptide (TPR) repeat protein